MSLSSSILPHCLCLFLFYWNYFVFLFLHKRFTNLGILHVTKKKVPDVLVKRLIQQTALRGQVGDAMEIDQETAQLSPG